MRTAIAFVLWQISTLLRLVAILFDTDAVQAWNLERQTSLKAELAKYGK